MEYKHNYTFKVIGESKRIRIPKQSEITEGNVVLVEITNSTTITIRKIAESEEEWSKSTDSKSFELQKVYKL